MFVLPKFTLCTTTKTVFLNFKNLNRVQVGSEAQLLSLGSGPNNSVQKIVGGRTM